MDKKETMLAVLKTVKEKYNINNRAVAKGSERCMYQTPEGRRCAVGMYMRDDMANAFAHADYDASTLDSLHNLDTLLKEEYRGLPLEFWEDLQTLHDRSVYWNEDGLTFRGREVAHQIQTRIEEDYA